MKFVLSVIISLFFSTATFAKTPDVIFFDWDGTISDNSENLSFAFGNALLKYGITKDELNMIRDNERNGNIEYIWEWAEKRFDKKTFDAMEKHYHYLYREVAKINYTLLPNVIDFLEVVKKKNIPAMVISNRNGTAVRLEAKKNDLTKYFNNIFGEHDFKGVVKPNINYTKYVAEKSGLKYNSCWMIGDGETDIEQGVVSNCKIFFVGRDVVIDKNDKYKKLVKDGVVIKTNYKELLHFLINESEDFEDSK